MIFVREQIVAYLNTVNVSFDLFSHPPCASSEESAKARKEAGAGNTVGAKALLVKNKQTVYSVCVVSGTDRLNSKKVRHLIGKHGFVTPETMEAVTGGLRPGHMPPFGPQIFPNITNLIIDMKLSKVEKLGFNAGEPTTSIVLSGRDYLRACRKCCVLSDITE